MKNDLPQSAFYFSAYPLKALNLTEAERKSYLHIYTKSDKNIKRSLRSKVLPMINPYKASDTEKTTEIKNIQTDQIEERENDWFASYE